MKAVTIYQTFNQADAQLVRSRLEAVNFHPFIANENVGPMARRTFRSHHPPH
jgi:hypothetical protein